MKALEWIQELNECRSKGMKVFSIPELMNLSGDREDTLRRSLVRLREKGIIRPCYMGLWGFGKDITLEDLFLKIDPDSYVSCETVLGRSNILNSMTPDLTCASLTQSRVVETKVGTIVFHKINRNLFFGYDDNHFASPEKAFLDFIYLKMKAGYEVKWKKLNFDPVDMKRIKLYLKAYPAFVEQNLRAKWDRVY